MKPASPITNQYQDFKVLNLAQLLHRTEGRGPYMITQDGCDPNDPTMRACSFVLTRRGTWLHFYLYLALPEPVRRSCAQFETITEVLQHARSLPEKVTVEDAASLQDLLHQSGFEPDAADAAGRALLQEIKNRHGRAPDTLPA